MTLSCRIKRRHADKSVNACLALQITVGVCALYHNGRALYTRLIAVKHIENFYFISMFFSKTRIHTVKHKRPILRFRSSCTGMEIQNCVVHIVFAA